MFLDATRTRENTSVVKEQVLFSPFKKDFLIFEKVVTNWFALN
jgi:hypothetical protein